jgi:hypothetical protein
MKTLKDIGWDESGKGLILLEASYLREVAREWIEELKKSSQYYRADNWITHFFNLEDKQ